MHGHANYGGRSNFPSPMNLRVFIVELVIRRAKQTIAGFPCAARYEILGKSPTGAQMWNICNEPNWLIILVLLLFGIIAPFAAVRVRSRASSKRLIKEFRNVWWVRYAREKKLDDEEIADRLISYLDRLVDRHINKARGILPFNSILLAVFTFEANRFASARPYLLSPITGLLVSSVLCVSMFLVYWQRDVYASWSSEVDFSVQKVIKTSIKIEWAAWISLSCMLIGAVVIAIVEGDLMRYLSPIFRDQIAARSGARNCFRLFPAPQQQS